MTHRSSSLSAHINMEQCRTQTQRETLRAISHHWRQPLNQVALLASITMEDMANMEHAEIKRELEAILAIVHDLSKTIDNAALHLDPAPLCQSESIRTIMQRVLSEVSAILLDNNIEIQVACDLHVGINQPRPIQTNAIDTLSPCGFLLSAERFSCRFSECLEAQRAVGVQQVLIDIITKMVEMLPGDGNTLKLFLTIGYSLSSSHFEFKLLLENANKHLSKEFTSTEHTKVVSEQLETNLQAALNIANQQLSGELWVTASADQMIQVVFTVSREFCSGILIPSTKIQKS